MKWLTFSCLICALNLYFAQKLLEVEVEVAIACVQTSPISFVARGKGTFPFPHAAKEIGDVCTQAMVARTTKVAANTKS